MAHLSPWFRLDLDETRLGSNGNGACEGEAVTHGERQRAWSKGEIKPDETTFQDRRWRPFGLRAPREDYP